MLARKTRELPIEESHLSFAREITKRVMVRFGAGPQYYDEYVSAAYSGLVEAAARYDPGSGVPFERYAFHRVRGAVIDYVRETSTSSSREYRAARLLQASDCLTDDFSKIRARLNMQNVDQGLAEVLDYAAKGALIFRLNYTDCEEEIFDTAEREPDPENQVALGELKKFLVEAISELPPREREILEAFYFEDLTFQEIADDRLKVTRSWVSRIHSRALGMLKRAIEAKCKQQEKR